MRPTRFTLLCAMMVIVIPSMGQLNNQSLEFYLVKSGDTIKILDQSIPSAFDGMLVALLLDETESKAQYEEDMFVHVIHARHNAPIWRKTVRGLNGLKELSLAESETLLEGDHIFLECRLAQHEPFIYKFKVQ